MKQTLVRHFYWIQVSKTRINNYFLQEEETDKDEENCKKVHNLMNGIKDDAPATSSAPAGAGPQMTAQ